MKTMMTQQELADMAGVTRLTVQRALSGKAGVGEKTRARIQDLAQKMGYMPNAAARATRCGKFNSIGLLMSFGKEGSSVTFVNMMRTIREELHTRDQMMLINDLPDPDDLKADQLPRMFRELLVDGLIVNVHMYVCDRLQSILATLPIPYVAINSDLPSNAIRPDDDACMEDAVKTLVELGHQRIAYLGPDRRPMGHYSIGSREDGYLRGMRRAGLQPMLYTSESFIPMSKRQAWIGELLTQTDRPTALITYDRYFGLPAYGTAMSMGIRVPEDLSLITTHDFYMTDMGVGMSTMQIPAEAIGERSVSMLNELLTTGSKSLPSVTLPFTFLQGDTIAIAPV